MIENSDYYGWDADKAVNGIELSLTAAGVILDSGIDERSVSGPFLGLAAGMGIAERGLARRFGLDDVTLVDRDLELLDGFAGTYVRSDLFAFVNDSRAKFGFVTVFGVEYALRDLGSWQSLWRGLENVSKIGTIVLVYPHDGKFGLPDSSVFKVKVGGNIFVTQRIS